MTLHVYNDLEQRSEEWYAARRGIVTASAVGRLISIGPPDAITVECPICHANPGDPCVSIARKAQTPIKSLHDSRTVASFGLPPVYGVADTDTARGLIATLACERITGLTESAPITSDMWRGIDAEPIARDYYTEHHAPVTQVGLMVRDDWGYSIGYSPDGLVGDHGLIEIKAPRAKNHLSTVLADEVPAHNMAQLQAGLLVSGREWVDFIPFFGGLPLWVKRVYADPEWQRAIVAAAAHVEEVAAEMVATYSTATEGLPATEPLPDYDDIKIKVA